MATKDDPSSQSEAENENSELTNSTKRKAALEEIEVDVAAPEPPSKRARRALKKGKSLPAKGDSDDEGKDGATGEKDKKGKTRSEHSVWVGNLPFTITPLELRKWLIDNSGEVITEEMITRIKLPTSKDPARDKSVKAPNKGFAYVDFTDIGGKVAAIALSETEVNGRRLLIKDATSFEGRPKKEPEPEAVVPGEKKQGGKTEQDINASRKVFVGNMSFKTTDDDLRRNFEKCGEIEWVKVASFEDSGKCKGYGWVKFKEPEAAAWAVKGFVKIKEQIETEDDFKEKDDDEEESKDKNKASQKQFKTRKWWVNRMLGRELKIELAEDDQVRYKKRFGKDAKKGENDSDNRRPPRENGSNKPLKTATDIQVARLTGAVVEHTGTKMTFD